MTRLVLAAVVVVLWLPFDGSTWTWQHRCAGVPGSTPVLCSPAASHPRRGVL